MYEVIFFFISFRYLLNQKKSLIYFLNENKHIVCKFRNVQLNKTLANFILKNDILSRDLRQVVIFYIYNYLTLSK